MRLPALWPQGRPDPVGGIDRSLDRWDACLLAILATIFAILATISARSSSATFDEVSHLPSGYTYRLLGDYRLNPEHPPLIKALSAWPLGTTNVWPAQRRVTPGAPERFDDQQAFGALGQAWNRATNDFTDQWSFGRTLLFGVRDHAWTRHGLDRTAPLPSDIAFSTDEFVNDGPHLLFLGRLPNIGIGILLLGLIYAWAARLGGRRGAVIATTLAAVDPNLIAHGSVVTTDIGITTFLFATIYATWRALQAPTIPRLLLIGLFTGLAAVTKYSAILLGPILAVVALVWVLIGQHALTRRRRIGIATLTLLTSLVITYTTIWTAYGFRFAATNAETPDRAPALVQTRLEALLMQDAANRRMWTASADDGAGDGVRQPRTAPAVTLDLPARTLLFLSDHRILPHAYVEGIAYARASSIGRMSYFRGTLTTHGSTLFFPVSLLAKTPDVSLVLIVLALVVARRRRLLTTIDWACLLIPPALILIPASRSSLNLGYRHVLPVLPFLFTSTALLALPLRQLRPRAGAVALGLGLLAAIASAQLVRTGDGTVATTSPYPLTYFNWSTGGPDHGDRLFVDSNLDWGQALPALRAWITERSLRTPIYLCYFGTADPRAYGIRFRPVPGCGDRTATPVTAWQPAAGERPTNISGVTRGDIIAVSATFLVGLYRSDLEHDRLTSFLARRTRPVGIAGHAIHLFEVTDAAP